MSDTITIKVKESSDNGDKWMQYDLSYEEFAYIQPVLKGCQNKHECPDFDPADPESAAKLVGAMFLPFTQHTKETKKGIIYNLRDKPAGMTRAQIVDIYNRHGFVFIDNKRSETRQIE